MGICSVINSCHSLLFWNFFLTFICVVVYVANKSHLVGATFSCSNKWTVRKYMYILFKNWKISLSYFTQTRRRLGLSLYRPQWSSAISRYSEQEERVSWWTWSRRVGWRCKYALCFTRNDSAKSWISYLKALTYPEVEKHIFTVWEWYDRMVAQLA